MVENSPAMQKTWVRSLGWEEPQPRTTCPLGFREMCLVLVTASPSPWIKPLAWEGWAVRQIILLGIWRAWPGDVQLKNVRMRWNGAGGGLLAQG